MKFEKSILTTLFVFGVLLQGFSQRTTDTWAITNSVNSMILNEQGNNKLSVNKTKYAEGIDGSIFYRDNDEFQSGGIKFPDGKELINLKIRYDLFDQVLDIMVGDNIRSFSTGQIRGFFINDVDGRKFFTTAPDDMVKALKMKDGAFIQTLNDGDPVALYKYSEVTLLDPTYKPQFNIGSKNYSAQRGDIYILANGDQYEDLKKFNKSSKKKLLKSLNVDKDKMDELIDMPTDTEADYIQFVERLNKTLAN